MTISCFDDLLQAARAQPTPQRLLFVFTQVELPDDSTPEQRANFEQGHGGALVPHMCVDKDPAELQSFEQLVKEAEIIGQSWGLVFAAGMSGPLGLPPRSEDADAPLKEMVEAIRQGKLDKYIPFDAQGQAVNLT